MKWYNHRAHKAHQEDIKVQRDTHLGKMLPHVSQIANTFSRESIACGALNFQDLYQAGYLGLLEAWDKVDWDMIRSAPNPDATLWSFLKKRIRWAIRRDIDKYGSIISTPINKMEEKRNNLKLNYEDKVFVTIFPNLWEIMAIDYVDNSPWVSLQLEEIINDELYKVEHNADNRHILLAFYGIGIDKQSQKELAKTYKTTHGNIQKIIQRTRGKLNNNDFKLIIENFYKN